MRPLPAPDALEHALRALGHVPGGVVGVNTLHKLYGNLGLRLAGRTRGTIAVSALLARVGEMGCTETVHSAAKRRGLDTRTLLGILRRAGLVPEGTGDRPGTPRGGRWHRLPTEVIDRTLVEYTSRKHVKEASVAAKHRCACGGVKNVAAEKCLACAYKARRGVLRPVRRLDPAVVREIFTSSAPWATGAALQVNSGMVFRILRGVCYRDVTGGLICGHVMKPRRRTALVGARP